MTEGKRPLIHRARPPGRGARFGAGVLAAALACWPAAAWAQQGRAETGSKAPALLIPLEPPGALPDHGVYFVSSEFVGALFEAHLASLLEGEDHDDSGSRHPAQGGPPQRLRRPMMARSPAPAWPAQPSTARPGRG